MKKLVFIIALSLPGYAQIIGPVLQGVSGGGGAAISIVQLQTACGASGAALSATLPVAATAGNTLVCAAINYNNISPVACTSAGSGTVAFTTDLGGFSQPGSGQKFTLERYVSVPSGITGATFTGTNTEHCVALLELANADTGTIDKVDTAEATGVSTTWTGNPKTPTSGKSTFVISLQFNNFAASTCGAGFTDLNQALNISSNTWDFAFCGKLVSVPSGAYSPTGSIGASQNWEVVDAAYKGLN